MRFRMIYFLLLIIVLSCQEDDEQIIVDDPTDEKDITVSMGAFVDLGTGHRLSGKVLLLSDDQNMKTLRFENFSVVNGPDVNVYLSKTAQFQDVLDLGDLKGTAGNINYSLDESIHKEEYKFVLIWCVKYAVLFGYAELK